jgi:hypothetical protein
VERGDEDDRYGRPHKDGHYQAFIADGDGANERRVAFASWRDDRHQFPAAWHPAGDLLAMLVEQNEHERSSVDAIPATAPTRTTGS